MTGTQMRVAALIVLLLPGLARAQSAGPAPAAAGDGVSDGIGRGAAIGALAVLPLAVAQVKSCGTGCDQPSIPALLLAWALFGAAAGSATDTLATSPHLREIAVEPRLNSGSDDGPIMAACLPATT